MKTYLRYFMDKAIFDTIPDGAVIATGECRDNSDGLNMSRSGNKLKWIAKKGFADDWCIYTHFDFHTLEEILSNGDKVCDKRNIDNILKVTDEIWAKYRF